MRIPVMRVLVPVPVLPAVGTRHRRLGALRHIGSPSAITVAGFLAPSVDCQAAIVMETGSRAREAAAAVRTARQPRTLGRPGSKPTGSAVRSRSALCHGAEGLDLRLGRVLAISPTTPSTPRTQVEGSGTR